MSEQEFEYDDEHSWSKELDYDQEVERLKTLIAAHTGKQKAYYSILLIELTQSCRISESCDAALKWAKSKKILESVKVKVRKRKDTYWRDVFIPKSIRDDSKPIKRFLNKSELSPQFIDNIKHFARYHLSNTHAYRHAGITHQGEMNIPDQIIARGTGHKKVEHIRIYTQRSAAVKVLREMANRA